MPVDLDASLQFLHLEYRALREEMLGILADARSLERYIAVGCAVIWGWFSTHPNSPRVTLTLPLVLTGLGFIRDRSYGKEVLLMGKYLLKIEERFLSGGGRSDSPAGWEHFISKLPPSRGESPYLFWGILLACGLAAFWLLPAGKIF